MHVECPCSPKGSSLRPIESPLQTGLHSRHALLRLRDGGDVNIPGKQPGKLFAAAPSPEPAEFFELELDAGNAGLKRQPAPPEKVATTGPREDNASSTLVGWESDEEEQGCTTPNQHHLGPRRRLIAEVSHAVGATWTDQPSVIDCATLRKPSQGGGLAQSRR